MVSLNLSLDAENAVWVTAEALARHRLRAVRDFDLRDALSGQDVPCPCPHHGTVACDCNYIVLSVYPAYSCSENGALLAGRILIHTHDGIAWLSCTGDVDGQNARRDPDADQRFLRALAEIVAGADSREIGEAHGA